MFYYGLHLIAVFSWAIFLLQFIKSAQNDLPDKYIFGFLSLFFMFLVLWCGVKLMLMNPQISKTSGAWLHTKLTLALLMIIENFYIGYLVLKNKSLSQKTMEILYWCSYLVFVLMIALTMFRPF